MLQSPEPAFCAEILLQVIDDEERIRHMENNLCIGGLWKNRFVYHETICDSKISEVTSLSSLYGLSKS